MNAIVVRGVSCGSKVCVGCNPPRTLARAIVTGVRYIPIGTFYYAVCGAAFCDDCFYGRLRSHALRGDR